MDSGSACSTLFCVLLILQCGQWSKAREMPTGHKNAIDDHIELYANEVETKVHDHHALSHVDHVIDPALNVFFNLKDLNIGTKMPIYFPIKDPSTSPPLLSREEANSIPFTSSKLPYLLEFFSFSTDSPQAKAMKETLQQCEFEPAKGESKFCATSLESMLDSTREIIPMGSQISVLTTTHLTEPTMLLQNYTFLEAPTEILAPKMVACHTMPYPYAVYYCHHPESQNRLFKVLLGGENGGRVDAAAICHMDTSQWDSDHVAFMMLGITPGSGPVCHFFPADNIVWFQPADGM